jgi:5-methylthioribose kinase
MPTALTLDIETAAKLLAWLRETGRIPDDETPEVTVLAGGVSSRAVLLRSAAREWVLKQALSKLRVPVDWFSDVSRVHREASALRWLGELAPEGATPEFVFEDEKTHVVCMKAIPQPHENWKTLLLAGDARTEHVDAFAELIATIHVRSGRRLEELEPELGDQTFFESLRLEPYYRYTATQVPAAAAFLGKLQQETRTVRTTLVHGDYSPKNVLIWNGTLVLVDHEVAHVGDPAFDLGFSLTHLLSKARHLPDARGRFLDASHSYWSRYAAMTEGEPWRTGLEPRIVRHTLACLLARVAGCSQLEYLQPAEKERQRETVLALIEEPAKTIRELIDEWAAALG